MGIFCQVQNDVFCDAGSQSTNRISFVEDLNLSQKSWLISSRGSSLYDSNRAVNCLNVNEWFFWRVLYLTVSLSVQGRVLCISRGSIPTYCHYIKICCGSLSADPRNITVFLFFHCWSRGSASVSPGEGVPSLCARTISHVGLRTLWSAFPVLYLSAKTSWEKCKESK